MQPALGECLFLKKLKEHNVRAQTDEIVRWDLAIADDVHTAHLESLLKPERSRKSHSLEREFDKKHEHRFLRVKFEQQRSRFGPFRRKRSGEQQQQ